MNDRLELTRCGCGGKAEIFHIAPEGYEGSYCVRCTECLTQTPFFNKDKEKAIETWNRAMGGNAEEKLKVFWDGISAEMKEERTAKVKYIVHTHGYPDEGLCGNCNEDVNGLYDYCPYCGTKLEWT